MSKGLIGAGIVVVLLAVAGVVLANWSIPAPQTPIEKPLPADAFKQ